VALCRGVCWRQLPAQVHAEKLIPSAKTNIGPVVSLVLGVLCPTLGTGHP
jgi:hypothetical protein